MDKRLESVLSGIEIATAAAGALNATSATLISPPAMTEIMTPHNDLRTLGIVKVSGTAQPAGSSAGEPWSAIAKVIDFGADPGMHAYWTDPKIEDLVYELGCFADDGRRFRPARCYHVSQPSVSIKVLWLEDLTGAEGPPFDVEQLMRMARHLGEWNGFYLSRTPDARLVTPTNSYLLRWKGAGFEKLLLEMNELQDHDVTRQMYGNLPASLAFELYDLLDQLNEQTAALDHSLAFGDCNVGNLFLKSDETVAIDWASLTSDPTGVDAGCMVGSAMTWGKGGVDIAINERQLFESYLDGLAASGWTGSKDQVRRGFFGQFGVYLFHVAMMPALAAVPGKFFRRDFLEKRFQTPWDEIPPLMAGIIQLIPSFIEELKTLAE